MENRKSGFVSIIGRPNVGKSTLMNHLIGQKIAITSSKPQTTRNRIRTVYTDERGQIVFLDTPGIHKARNKLGAFMVETAEKAVYEADVILWLVEPVSFIGENEQIISESLKKARQPVLLVINKIDTVTKQQIDEAEQMYRGLMDYTRVLRVSALRNTGASKVLDAIFEYLEPGPMYYDEDTVTDQPVRQIAAEIVREKALRLLSDEIPHGVAVTIDRMTQRKDHIWDIDASVICERESHKGIIIGKGGQMLKKIGIQARQDIEKLLEDQVNLKLWVKVRENWRDSDLYMKNFGYHENSEL